MSVIRLHGISNKYRAKRLKIPAKYKLHVTDAIQLSKGKRAQIATKYPKFTRGKVIMAEE
jgi:hypothetical protein